MDSESGMSRRDFLRIFGRTAGGVLLATHVPLDVLAEEVSLDQIEVIRSRADALWDLKRYAEATKLYKKLTPREILGDDFTHVGVDNGKITNYDNTLGSNQRGVFELFYVSAMGPKVDISQRAAIISRQVKRQIGNALNYRALDWGTDLRTGEKGERLSDTMGYPSAPCFGLYAGFDLLSKQPAKSGGEARILNFYPGGPKHEHRTPNYVSNFVNYWIATNVTNPNGKFLYRREFDSTKKQYRWIKKPYA